MPSPLGQLFLSTVSPPFSYLSCLKKKKTVCFFPLETYPFATCQELMIQGWMRVAMFPSRGTGEGSQNLSYVSTYLRVLERNGMSADDFKIALFLDTANWRKRSRAAGAYDCDFSNHYSTTRVIFTENLQPFFETLPRDRWYRIMGRPVVQVWGVNPAGGFSQHRASCGSAWSGSLTSVRGGTGPLSGQTRKPAHASSPWLRCRSASRADRVQECPPLSLF